MTITTTYTEHLTVPKLPTRRFSLTVERELEHRLSDRARNLVPITGNDLPFLYALAKSEETRAGIGRWTWSSASLSRGDQPCFPGVACSWGLCPPPTRYPTRLASEHFLTLGCVRGSAVVARQRPRLLASGTFDDCERHTLHCGE
jgi:hypothetical protein